MKFGTVCSGIEAVSVAWEPLGFEPQFFSEIEPFPSALLNHRWPHVPNLGNMLDIDGKAWRGKLDILWGSTPCFPKGAMVATKNGFIPIEKIKPGDQVLTHNKQFKPVLKIGSKMAPLFRVEGQGHQMMLTTEEHPFLSCKKVYVWDNFKRAGKYVPGEIKWTEAKHLAGSHWACVADWPHLPIPKIDLMSLERISWELSTDFFYLVGAWLGDGWFRKGKTGHGIVLGLSDTKYNKMKPLFDRIGSHSVVQERTVKKVTFFSNALVRWLLEHFGEGGGGKRLPMWALGMPLEYRNSLYQGYVDTDGTNTKTGGKRTTTISRQLALTMRMLANSMGFASSVREVVTPDEYKIEGRTVNQQNYFTTTFSPSTRSVWFDNGYAWQLVRKVYSTNITDIVYNLEVEDDNSYTVDGIVVHNCQSFSLAGLREGTTDKRGALTLGFVKLANDINPKFLCWENVKGVLSDRRNAFGNLLAGLAGEDEPLIPPGGKWTHAGYVLGPERAIAWRLFDAQYSGVPQRRERVFLIACPRDGPDPRRILFESEGTRWLPRQNDRSRKTDTEVGSSVEAMTVSFRGRSGGAMVEVGKDVASCLLASQGGGDKPYVLITKDSQSRIRRLTPLECERLMGMSEGHTKLDGWDDGVRYKAIGNSINVADVRWIGKLIMAEL